MWYKKQDKSERFDSCQGPSNLTRIGFKTLIFSTCDLEILWMTSKTIKHLFYTTSSCVHHFKDIGEFRLELQSGNAKFGSKSAIFLSCVTLKFDEWPWKTIGTSFILNKTVCIVSNLWVNSNWSFRPEMLNSGQNWRFFFRVTLKFDRWTLNKMHISQYIETYAFHTKLQFKEFSDWRAHKCYWNAPFIPGIFYQ